MKKELKASFMVIGAVLLCSMYQVATQAGLLSVDFNGNPWSCNQIGASIADVKGKQWLQIHVQNPKVEYVYISIGDFNGQGTYEFGGKQSAASLKISYQNKRYIDNPKLGGGGNGTINITAYSPKPGPGKPGKITGEFSGTLKDASGNAITIKNGKFNSTMVF